MDEIDVVGWIRRVIDPEPDAEVWAAERDGLEKAGRVKVVDADTMDADTFWRHVRLRHIELQYVRSVSVLRDEHYKSHRLTAPVLNHFHEGLDDGP
jgi:hypothetical protein